MYNALKALIANTHSSGAHLWSHQACGTGRLIMSTKPVRVEAFSDGVLAIVITLLVLELRIPHLQDALSRQEAWGGLRLLVPKFGSFLLSFAYVAVFWANHHHFFDLITEVNPGLLWLNTLFLLFLCFMPFPTAFIGEYPANPVALMLFAVVVMGAGFIFTMMWWYAYRSRLTEASVHNKTMRQAVQNGLLGPPLYAMAGLMAFIAPWMTWTVFAAVPVFFFFHSMHKPGHP